MIGLITVGPRSNASASWETDHRDQRGSTANTSSRTLESTSVAPGGVTRRGSEFATISSVLIVTVPRPRMAPGERFALSGLDADETSAAVVELEVDLGARLDPELTSDRERDRDLSLAGYAHDPTPAGSNTGRYYFWPIFSRFRPCDLDGQRRARCDPPAR